MKGKIWMLFDGRYRADEDSAVCFECCDTLQEVRENADDYGNDTVIVEGETEGNEILNSKIVN